MSSEARPFIGKTDRGVAPPFRQIEIQQSTGIVCALGTDGRVYVSASPTGWIRLASTVVEQVTPAPPVGSKAPDGSELQ